MALFGAGLCIPEVNLIFCWVHATEQWPPNLLRLNCSCHLLNVGCLEWSTNCFKQVSGLNSLAFKSVYIGASTLWSEYFRTSFHRRPDIFPEVWIQSSLNIFLFSRGSWLTIICGVVWKFGHKNYLRNFNLFLKILFIHGYLPETPLRDNICVTGLQIFLRTADK